LADNFLWLEKERNRFLHLGLQMVHLSQNNCWIKS
jgi:hypothetical protein